MSTQHANQYRLSDEAIPGEDRGRREQDAERDWETLVDGEQRHQGSADSRDQRKASGPQRLVQDCPRLIGS